MPDLMKIRVKYRRAKYLAHADSGAASPSGAPTLEQNLRDLLEGELGKDVNSRELKIQEDERHSLVLHFHQMNVGALAFELLHLDDRTEIPTWKRPSGQVPHSGFGGTKLGPDDVSLQEPAYLLVSGNHIAMIERVGLRLGHVQNYLNEILNKGKVINLADSYWELVPKIESIGTSALKGGVEKIIVVPRAALAGEGATAVTTEPKKRGYTRKIDELIGYGDKIFEMMRVFGAQNSDIEKLREKMSSDLVLKARVELTVSKAERASEAKVSADDIEIAFANITDTSDINIIDKDGKTNGSLTQLSHIVEVKHENGMLDLSAAVNALAAAMSSWVAKGAIELS